MATIVFASSKGGAGKTTAATVLASELARQGRVQHLSVALIDADPNQHSAQWARLPGKPANLQLYELYTDTNQKNDLMDIIDEAELTHGFVIIDMEGTASMDVGWAISRADLVVVPCQGSDKDAIEAIKTIKMVTQQSRALDREIAFCVLMTRTSAAIVTRGFKAIIEQFEAAQIPLYATQLIEREAFRAIAAFGGIVNALPKSQVAGVDKAAANAHAFTKETIALLESHQQTALHVVGG